VAVSGASAGLPLYIAHTVPGLEEVALQDVRAQTGELRVMGVVKGFDERTSLVLFRSAAEPEALLVLRSIEDLFVLVVDARGIHGGYSAPKEVRALIAEGQGLDAAASLASAVRLRRRRKTTFRVIARKAGSHAFRRSDIGRAVAGGIADRFPDWLEVEDDAQFEVWVSLIEDRLIVGIRLSDAELRNRTYRVTNLPGALKPTVAYLMATLSGPQPDDVVLDPMCGAGTLLIERAHAGRYRRLLGGDIVGAAVTAAADNVGPRYQPLGLARWDARRLPLPDASVSVVLANLPFGKQFGTPEQNQSLYPALLDEWLRLLQPSGRLVLLTPENALLRRLLLERPRLQSVQTVDTIVRGQHATIHALRDRSGDAANLAVHRSSLPAHRRRAQPK
jgi:tRNA (guanine6-N2)-methyltransferase